VVSDGANDATASQIGTNIVEIRRRPSEATGGMNEIDRVGEIGIGGRYFVPSSDHRNELALSVGVAVDVLLGCLDRPMPGQQLNVAQ
jgi:hypothetical protein